MSDAAGSIGAIIAGVALLIGDWFWLDTPVSIIIGLFIFMGSVSLVKQALHILLEGVSPDIDCEVVSKAEIDTVHGIHAWLIGNNEIMITIHLVPAFAYSYQVVLEKAKAVVKEQFRVHHITFQVKDQLCSEAHK